MISSTIRTFQRIAVVTTLALALAQFAAAAAAQVKSSQKDEVANPKDGAVIFKQDCAVCHGPAAKGDGPAAKDLKAKPPNLTTLAQRHGGEFPTGYVLDVLHNGITAPSHGTVEMPVWGPIFATMNRENELQSKLRVNNLVGYLKAIQAK
jgi:mono/diheme cytochrome c family protein